MLRLFGFPVGYKGENSLVGAKKYIFCLLKDFGLCIMTLVFCEPFFLVQFSLKQLTQARHTIADLLTYP